jgi:hypothetical protein
MDSKQNRKKTNPDNGMKNSSPSAAQVEANLALTAFVNQELRSLVDAGLTHAELDSAECGRNRALADSEFTTVTYSKRAPGPEPAKGDEGRSRSTPPLPGSQSDASFPALGSVGAEVPQWKDPFGADAIPVEVNPASLVGRPSARTKQCARRFTGSVVVRSRSYVPKAKKSKSSRALSSSGSSSDRSRTRLWRKGAAQDSVLQGGTQR